MKKRALALILAMVMALSLAACGGSGDKNSDPPENSNPSSNSQPPQQEGENEPSAPGGYLKDNITVAISADGGTFDPFASFVNWGTAVMTPLIFQGLIQTDYDYNIFYVMAKSIEQVDDLHWSLEIWDCIDDTAGNHITIDDVIWGYQQVLDTGNAGAIPKFVKLEKTGDYTAVMELSEPFGDGDMVKHFGNVKILSKKSYEENCNGDMTTTPHWHRPLYAEGQLHRLRGGLHRKAYRQ